MSAPTRRRAGVSRALPLGWRGFQGPYARARTRARRRPVSSTAPDPSVSTRKSRTRPGIAGGRGYFAARARDTRRASATRSMPTRSTCSALTSTSCDAYGTTSASRLKLVQLDRRGRLVPRADKLCRDARVNGAAEARAAPWMAIGPWVNRLYRYRKRDAMISDEWPRGEGPLSRAGRASIHVSARRRCRPAFRHFDELIRYCTRDLLVDGLFTDFPGAVSELLRRNS